MNAILSLLVAFSFLGFDKQPNISDVIGRFGNPIKIEQNEQSSVQFFTFKRESYLLTVACNKKGETLSMQAIGTNKSVRAKGVALGDDFGKIIKIFGAPQNYIFADNTIDVVYKHYAFKVSRLEKNSVYKVIGITFNFQEK